MPDVGGTGPVAAEVPALDQHVDGGHDPTVGHGEDGRVVPRRDEHVVADRQPAQDLPDQPELTGRADRALVVFMHRRILLPLPVTLVCAGKDLAEDAPGRATEVGMTVQAYILIQTEVGRAADVAAGVSSIQGVMSASDVTGPYDVIVRAQAETMDELGDLVVKQVQGVEGITRTLTCPVVHI